MGIWELFDLTSGQPIAAEQEGQAHALQLAIKAGLASLVFAAIYGLAAGSAEPTLAMANVLKVPLVVLLSVACALPVGLLLWKLTAARSRAADLVVSVATGVFTATLLLAATAPLLALYYHTTELAAAPLAMAITSVAVALGLFNAARSALHRRPEATSRRETLIPMGAMMGVLLLALVQLIHLASPILPEHTIFDRGVDSLVER